MSAPLIDRQAAIDVLTTHRHGPDKAACHHCARFYGDILDRLIDARLLTDLTVGAAEDRGPEDCWPTGAQLLRRFVDATPDERLAFCERAAVNSQKAHECFLHDHRGRIAHLEHRLAYLTPNQVGTGSVASICPSCGHGYEQPAHPDCRRPERHPQPAPTEDPA